MQLKGLVRFFVILLIVYSFYQLSFTWFVRSHEKKMEASAQSFVKVNYPTAAQKYPNNKDSQEIYQEVLNTIRDGRLKRLLDSTKDVTVTYGLSGAVSYQKAKSEELNLGLDLQGGMSVTLEVEMTDLLRVLSNYSADPNFAKALANADVRKGNSDADFITLFVEEYQKLAGVDKLSGLFAAANKEDIKIGDSDNKVKAVLQKKAGLAFDNTYKVLSSRIDQFGVAQPSINPDRDKGIITVELPGVKDKARVRENLTTSANLQFWEVYNFSELLPNLKEGDAAFFTAMGGGKKVVDSASTNEDTSVHSTAVAKAGDTTKDGAKIGKIQDLNSPQAKTPSISQEEADAKKHLAAYIDFPYGQNGTPIDNGTTGRVLLKDTALVRSYLESDAVKSKMKSDVIWMYGLPGKDKDGKTLEFVNLYAIKTFGLPKAKIEGDVVTSAGVDFDEFGKPDIRMGMNTKGAELWKKMTTENHDRFIAIAIDNLVYSAPQVHDPIPDGNSSITGGFSTQEATDLSNMLTIGRLSATAKIVQEQEVGPTLGSEAIRGGLMAFGISFLVIFVLMLVYYNTSGWVANIALILNLLFTIGILAGFRASLTAPGIAGLVLTIGMAVDTNVIIYERIKEELTRGKGYIPAINEGYRRSLPPVLDGHVTTLLTAIILFYFGLGPVRGFATTQIIGICLSLFCGILVSRWVTEWFTNKKRHLEYFTGVSRRIFKHASYKFIEFRKIAYIISFVVLALGVSTYFHGFDYGVEFEGGRSYTVRFDKQVDINQIRGELKEVFKENAIIKTVGDASTLDITTSYLIADPRKEVDSLVETQLFNGLKHHFPGTYTFEQFHAPTNNIGKIGSKKVLPTISDDLKRGAVKATIFAILIIFLYIFIRFRDWRYSLGTIVALLHDVLVTLIVFSFARTIVPFPLEIDQHFIAALLTVIGFSMNDTVIVFDRIREDTKLYPSLTQKEIINKAINDTLSRTIMTSLTVFLTILILFILGGEATRGFAFAMLIGVITGVYSSIFVAAPILVDMGGGKKLGKAPDKRKLV